MMSSDTAQSTIRNGVADVAQVPGSPQRTASDPRNAWLATLCGLLLPPVGFAYVGKPLAVFVFYGAVVAFWSIMGWSGLAQSEAGILLIYVVTIGVTWVMALYCGIIARKTRGSYHKRWFNTWYFYVRGNSIDSRTVGPFDRSQLRGKVAAIFFSDDYRRLGSIR